MKNISDIEALQNAVDYMGMANIAVYEKPQEDRRKTVKKYFLNVGSETLSPNLDFNQMNHFILGFSRAAKIFNKNK